MSVRDNRVCTHDRRRRVRYSRGLPGLHSMGRRDLYIAVHQGRRSKGRQGRCSHGTGHTRFAVAADPTLHRIEHELVSERLPVRGMHKGMAGDFVVVGWRTWRGA